MVYTRLVHFLFVHAAFSAKNSFLFLFTNFFFSPRPQWFRSKISLSQKLFLIISILDYYAFVLEPSEICKIFTLPSKNYVNFFLMCKISNSFVCLLFMFMSLEWVTSCNVFYVIFFLIYYLFVSTNIK